MSEQQTKGWWQVWSVYLRPEALRMLFLGFSAGLPLLLVLGTLTLRLSEAGVSRASIGYLSWVALAYGFKWVWSPFVDRLPIPLLTSWLGRRRSWLLLAQAGIIAGLVGMALTDVQQGLGTLVGFALLVAFSSATQDIALDAYRIESAEKKVQAALSATYQAGYRLAMIWSGAGALWIAARVQQGTAGYDAYAWQVSYLVMAASVLVGVLTVLLSPEKVRVAPTPLPQDVLGHRLSMLERLALWVMSVVVAPFADFLHRYRWQAVIILALIAVYRISDIVMGVMSNPFYNEMGYTKEQIAAVSKVFGLIMTLVGTFIGGVMVMRAGVFRILMLGAALSAATNLLFAWLAWHGDGLQVLDINLTLWGLHLAVEGKVVALVAVISMDNLSGGIASAAFIGYLSSLTSIQFSATQYALFSSLMMLIPKFIGGFSGVFVDRFQYPTFFVCTALLGLPVLALVWLASRVHEQSKPVLVQKAPD
ncbi:hypothetical protein CUZ56_02154 [Saezia sanguinis]|uniref:Major facilitator superfamily (MFS) profile domain-containing protein n=1 Tax=Saezia sanguinis TaxID=1965230 RepID=A0A433SCE6_9BURK|nr:AmpG family muropeptide MFS transporter [Saezia sanguinis]RUS66428.1 hypothetical protein CUZ56_02154 [Saezia sanguinis]